MQCILLPHICNTFCLGLGNDSWVLPPTSCHLLPPATSTLSAPLSHGWVWWILNIDWEVLLLYCMEKYFTRIYNYLYGNIYKFTKSLLGKKYRIMADYCRNVDCKFYGCYIFDLWLTICLHYFLLDLRNFPLNAPARWSCHRLSQSCLLEFLFVGMTTI